MELEKEYNKILHIIENCPQRDKSRKVIARVKNLLEKQELEFKMREAEWKQALIDLQNKQREDFYETIKDDPEKIIAWCDKEIEEYRNLIYLIKKKQS
jgi:hypothetical protein